MHILLITPGLTAGRRCVTIVAKRRDGQTQGALMVDTLRFSPFADLGTLLAPASVAPRPDDKAESRTGMPKAGAPPVENAAMERDIFLDAMRGVKPLPARGERDTARPQPPMPPPAAALSEEREVLERLTRLITTGEDFVLSLTPEYLEGTGYSIAAEYARKLHAGDFAIQDYLDLHGLTAAAAKGVFDAFMRDAVLKGKSGLLIIHGRGLSSPAEPVLKKKVVEWLTAGVWRKYLFAYASARSCDGGTGATYVLLRRRPRKGPYLR